MTPTKTEQAILDAAVAACCRVVRVNLEIYFELGECVRKFESANQTRKFSRGKGRSRSDAITAIRAHCCKCAADGRYSAPQSDLYWYSAARSYELWTPEQRATMLRHNTPWIEVALMQALPDHGTSLIADLAAGRITRIQVRSRKAKRVRGPADRLTPALNSPLDTAICEFRVTGGESEEEMADKIAALLSAAQRMRLPVKRMVESALARLAGMAA